MQIANAKTFHRQSSGTLREFDSEIPNMYESDQNFKQALSYLYTNDGSVI